jgi:replicative DNA helicase
MDSDMFPDIVSIIEPYDFALPEHKLIFSAMKECYSEFKHFNSRKIHEHLLAKGTSSKIDISILMALEEMFAPSMSIKDYAKMVKKTSWSRTQIESVYELLPIFKNINDPDQKSKAIQLVEKLYKSYTIDDLSDFKPFIIAFKAAMERIMSPSTNKCSSSFVSLDSVIGGFYKQELTIIGARPAMGKTALITTMIKNMALNGLKVGFFSAEMSTTNIVIRLLSQFTGIPFRKIREWSMSAEEEACFFRAIDRDFKEFNVFIDEKTRNINDIKREARKLKYNNQVDIIFIDYLQRLTSGSRRMDYTEVTYVSGELKSLATELDIPIVCLSQLNRSVESRVDKRPMMSDLKESGGIEQDADMIMLLYRDEYYNPDTTDAGVLEIIVSKNRNDSTGVTKLYFDKTTMAFVENPWQTDNN